MPQNVVPTKKIFVAADQLIIFVEDMLSTLVQRVHCVQVGPSLLQYTKKEGVPD